MLKHPTHLNSLHANIYPESFQWVLSLQQLLDMTGDETLRSLCSPLPEPLGHLIRQHLPPVCHQTHQQTFFFLYRRHTLRCCTHPERLITDQ